MKKRFHFAIPWVIILAASCTTALAEDEAPLDARLVTGFTTPIKVEMASTATTWLLLVGLCMVCVGPLFLSAKRTHLD